MDTLFTQALGLTPPWSVTSVDFSPAQGHINFRVVCDVRHLACPQCGAAEQPIHDRKSRTWRHLNFFQYKAFIHADMPRVACGSCGKTHQVEAPWTRPGSGFTMLMEAFIVALCREMPMAVVARMLGVSGDRVGRVLDQHVKEARAKESYSEVPSWAWTSAVRVVGSATSPCSTTPPSAACCLESPVARQTPSPLSRMT